MMSWIWLVHRHSFTGPGRPALSEKDPSFPAGCHFTLRDHDDPQSKLAFSFSRWVCSLATVRTPFTLSHNFFLSPFALSRILSRRFDQITASRPKWYNGLCRPHTLDDYKWRFRKPCRRERRRPPIGVQFVSFHANLPKAGTR
jgi:hypothetical protein